MSRRAMLATLAVVAIGCGGPSSPPAPARVTARHLVVVTIDTLRADRLGAYGNTSVPTPNIDRLAREGARALDATTHVPITRPSHTSLFTARYPSEHGVRDNIARPLAADVPTLAELLHGQGFATAAFVSSVVLAKQSGLHRGFDSYDDHFDVDTRDVTFVDAVQRRGDATIGAVERWLDARTPETQAKRTALWVHLYDPHDPYEPPEPFASQFRGREYDGEVAWTDTLIGRLRATLEQHHLWDDALVVVAADHGEALGEHGETGHGFFVYETTIKVPLVLHGPGITAGTTIGGPFRLVDVAPTALALLGVPGFPAPVTGRDLSASLASPATPVAGTTYAESLTPLLHYQWSDLRVWRDGSWKYILAPRPELYDLAADPGETRDLSATQPATARKLRAALEAVLRAEREKATATDATAEIPAEMLQKLGALGYVNPGASKDAVAQGADPKDKIQEFQTLNGLMRDGLAALEAKRFAQGAATFAQLRKAGADSFQVHFYEGRALAGLGRFRDAEARFMRTLELMPTYGEAYLELANTFVARKDLAQALAVVRRGEASVPKEPSLVEREGQILQARGELPNALAAYERAAALAPTDALLRWRQGEVLLAMQRPADAVTKYREATTLDPSVPDFWNTLGMVEGGAGRNDAAAEAFRQAATRDPKNAQYAYNLGLVLMRAGRAEARQWFEQALVRDPAFRPARERLAELPR
ncbi:MAG: sulfatase-like hydrolase/transferase [Vicinamibacterales bacterium]